jgi:sugar phosphate isomerase/epimerase
VVKGNLDVRLTRLDSPALEGHMLYGGHIKSLEDIDFLRVAGFDFGEVVIRNKKVREYWKLSGIKNRGGSNFFLIAHGPFEGPPNDIDNLRNRYLPALCETVDVARIMEINFLTVHLWMDPRFVKSEVIEEKKRALSDLFNYGRDMRVFISLENLSETAEDLANILDAIPELGITLDVGHGELLSPINTSFAIMDKLMDHIRHLHFHDNRGGGGVDDDLHLPIRDGIVDFKGILTILLNKCYDQTLTLELENKDLIESRAKVKTMINDIVTTASACFPVFSEV